MIRWTTPAYIQVLKDSLGPYRKATSNQRAFVIQEIKETICNLARSDNASPPDDLDQKIRNWLHNHRRTNFEDNDSDSEPDGKSSFQLSKRKHWTLQRVMEQYEKKKINARAEELSEAKRGTSKFLSSYRLARTQICEELSVEEHAKYEGLVEKWNTEPVPPVIQRELASKKFMHEALNFTQFVKEQMGVEIFMLAGWQDGNGNIKKTKIHTPGPSSGSFKDQFHNLGGDVWQEWDTYLGQIWDDGRTKSPESGLGIGPLRKGTDVSIPWVLATDEDGWPILPLELCLPLPQLKEILRSFFTITYRNSAGNRKVTVPWQLMCDKPEVFISNEYLPEDVQLREPSKMHFSDVRKLCNFLHHRQVLGKKVLRFQYIVPQHRRGKLSKRPVVNYPPTDARDPTSPERVFIDKKRMEHMEPSTDEEFGPWDEADESDGIIRHCSHSVNEVMTERTILENNRGESTEKGDDGSPKDNGLKQNVEFEDEARMVTEKQGGRQKRRRNAEEEEKDEKNVLPYRTRSKRRASMEAKKRVFRPRQKRQ